MPERSHEPAPSATAEELFVRWLSRHAADESPDLEALCRDHPEQLLLEQGRIEEAEAVYRRDLELHPENGWALRGLEECLRRSGREAQADETLARFRRSWAHADVEIRSSCFCRTGGA